MRELQKAPLPENVVIVEVGTAIIDALPELERADRFIIIDAMHAGEPPGSIYKAYLSDCSGAPTIASMHGFDIYRVLALAGRTEIMPTTVFGVEPERIDWSLSLSGSVAESLPILLEAVYKEITTQTMAEAS